MVTPTSPELLEQQALRLRPDDRLKLTRALVESFSGFSEEQIEQLWLDEAESRDCDIDSGKIEPIAGSEVFLRIRSRYR